MPALRGATNPLPRMSGGGTNCDAAQADASHPILPAQVVTADSPVILAMCGGGKRAAEAQPNGRRAQAKVKCAAARAPPAAEPARLQGQGANTAGAADGQAPADEADRHQKRGPGVLPLALAERVNIYTVCAHVEL